MKKLLLCLALLLPLGSAQTVRFGYVEWPDVTTTSYVASAVLEALGYDTSLTSLSLPIVMRGVSTGDLSVFMGLWIPSMTSMIEPYYDNGTVVLAARNLEGTTYRPAVPVYVYEAGVTSMADMNLFASEFGSRYYGIEPGNDGNEIMIEAIDADLYDLGNWQIIESSTEGMLTAVQRAIDRNQWIVFSGWSPHWMNSVHDIRYLEDPLDIWGDDGYIGTILNSTFAENNPNLERFFAQFVIDADILNAWVASYDLDALDADVVALEWLRANPDMVMMWTEGVTTADGGDAQAALTAAFGW